MKALYPASNQIPSLPESLLAVKIARHSRCSSCTCLGLRPPPDLEEVVLDNDTSDSEYRRPTPYISVCECGHRVRDHGADVSVIGDNEFNRRGRVAVRLDEFMEDAGRLLDFDYTDEDIDSLRKQMELPRASSPDSVFSDSIIPSPGKRLASPASSILSDSFDREPPHKKRRVSYSSLSDADSDSDEEDRPLAARMAGKAAKKPSENGARTTGQRSGKQVSSMKSMAQTAPASRPPPTDEERADMDRPANGMNGHETMVKVEDKMDEGQLDRLATGVTVDSSGASADPYTKPEKIAHVELRKGIIQVVPVENDRQPRSLVLLTGLKTLFQKQLPKMPREYIARLVYDNNSKCLGIIKRGYKVVGGICYRPFPHRGFAEIVFFATTSVDQVKGYGAMLMDHFKAHIKEVYPGMMHFLTYADNYAVGYFRKQGFSKEITIPRSVWAGYIKDYEGGTIMQCTMLPKVDYRNTRSLLVQQREAILAKIREMSRSHIVYDGLPQFQNGAEGVTVDPQDVPGLRESGWTPSMAAAVTRPSAKSIEHSNMEQLLTNLQAHPVAWAFLQPVNGDEVPDYYEVIKNPMDFSTMEHKLDTGQYTSWDAFIADARLVFENCRTYNPEGSIYHKNATKLERYMNDELPNYRPKSEQ